MAPFKPLKDKILMSFFSVTDQLCDCHYLCALKSNTESRSFQLGSIQTFIWTQFQNTERSTCKSTTSAHLNNSDNNPQRFLPARSRSTLDGLFLHVCTREARPPTASGCQTRKRLQCGVETTRSAQHPRGPTRPTASSGNAHAHTNTHTVSSGGGGEAQQERQMASIVCLRKLIRQNCQYRRTAPPL